MDLLGICNSLFYASHGAIYENWQCDTNAYLVSSVLGLMLVTRMVATQPGGGGVNPGHFRCAAPSPGK